MFALIAMTSALFSSVAANECLEEGLYVGGFGGVNFLHIDKASGIKPGFMGGVSIGYKFENSVRLEGEFAYRRNRMKVPSYYDGHCALTTHSVMANVYYDHDLGYEWTPYIGAGIGYAHNTTMIHTKGDGVFSSQNKFAYQVMAGVNYKICDKTYAGLEYKYFKPQKHAHDHAVAVTLKRYF